MKSLYREEEDLMAEVMTIANRKGESENNYNTKSCLFTKRIDKSNMIDLDPQANLYKMFWYGKCHHENIKTIGHLLMTELEEEESYFVEDYTKSYDDIDIILFSHLLIRRWNTNESRNRKWTYIIGNC